MSPRWVPRRSLAAVAPSHSPRQPVSALPAVSQPCQMAACQGRRCTFGLPVPASFYKACAPRLHAWCENPPEALQSCGAYLRLQAARSESFINGTVLFPLPCGRKERGEWGRGRKQQCGARKDFEKSPSRCIKAGARLPGRSLSEAEGFNKGRRDPQGSASHLRYPRRRGVPQGISSAVQQP